MEGSVIQMANVDDLAVSRLVDNLEASRLPNSLFAVDCLKIYINK